MSIKRVGKIGFFSFGAINEVLPTGLKLIFKGEISLIFLAFPYEFYTNEVL
jgi:hypothetical protein